MAALSEQRGVGVSQQGQNGNFMLQEALKIRIAKAAVAIPNLRQTVFGNAEYLAELFIPFQGLQTASHNTS